jgi:hypothetical protein
MTNGIIAFLVLFVSACGPSLSFGQQASFEDLTASESVTPQPLPAEDRRIFGVIPNNRTWPSLKGYKPLSTREKFEIARQDSFDRGTVILAAAFAADAQLTNSNPSFGQGARGYARYFGASYGDFVIGNYMSEAIFPTLLHQDPRYFRRGIGSPWSRPGVFHGSNLLDPHRFRPDSAQLLGDSWQFDCGRDFKRVLPRQQERHQFGNKARHTDRRRYGVERPEGILARCKPKVLQEGSSIVCTKPRA